ncbi:hypothetical protein GCM10011391_02580 [Pullulanibacillus camelliae]|uniref:PTS EIIA type-2 domain-containing protein n=1 Tax=Pullulanibacillus camelliae TaxID=1707096 RepID=A0A8J2VK08_9BACL|nr:PTS sugar transporter subunit IIA [Pullulanibacillus camelliae]GGE27628.1 hypothetical protein GCM10011391_02580 [Pullulanibacillus camelliae]
MKKNHKIRTVIITPAYLHQHNQIERYIQKYFDDDLEVEGIYEDVISDWNLLIPPELVITTQNAECLENEFATSNTEIVSIHEFMTKHDAVLIKRAVEKIKHSKYLRFLKQKVPELIRDEFFLKIRDGIPKEQIIKTIADVFQQYGYVDDDYLIKMNEREKVSSTAFPSGIAVPHTMKFESKKTGLMIIKPITPIRWDSVKVKLIIGISVNKEDSQMFNMIFPRIIELTAEPYNINYLVASASRYEFIQRLIELMAKDNYFQE